jgi:hypothetical protein
MVNKEKTSYAITPPTSSSSSNNNTNDNNLNMNNNDNINSNHEIKDKKAMINEDNHRK